MADTQCALLYDPLVFLCTTLTKQGTSQPDRRDVVMLLMSFTRIPAKDRQSLERSAGAPTATTGRLANVASASKTLTC